MFRGKLAGAVALVALLLVMVGSANALELAGPALISAQGGTTDNAYVDSSLPEFAELGTFGLSGLIKFNLSGEVIWVDVTLTYQDSYVNAYSAKDGFTCVLSTPSDVAYTLNNTGVGTLTLTVNANDKCTQTFNGGDLQARHSNAGNSIVFNLYVLGTQGRITATSSNLVDYSNDEIQTTTLTGSILLTRPPR